MAILSVIAHLSIKTGSALTRCFDLACTCLNDQRTCSTNHVQLKRKSYRLYLLISIHVSGPYAVMGDVAKFLGYYRTSKQGHPE